MIYNHLDIWQGKSFETYGEYSEEEVNLFSKIVKPGDTVLDIGANIGSFTVPLARLANPGTVMAFEPEKTAFYTLCGNIAINNIRNVFCFQQAVGNTASSVKVPELSNTAFGNYGGLELTKDYSNCDHYYVQISTIDSLNLTSCKLIKIDVEGMEKEVILGAKTTIEKLKPILYVENDREEKSEELIKTIEGFGYKTYSHKPPFFNLNNFFGETTKVWDKDIVSLNLLCFHPENLLNIDEIVLQDQSTP